MSMNRLLAMLLAVLASALVFSACGGNGGSSTYPADDPRAVFADRDASGEALANAWPGLVGLTGSDEGLTASPEEVRAGIALVKPYLDPAFRLQRAGGERYSIDSYVPLDVDELKVSDVVTTQPRDDIKVVRYVLRTPGATAPDESAVLGGGATPQLAVFRWDEQRGHWVVVSHANFNSPVAAVCNQAPIAVTKDRGSSSPADAALGNTLISQWRDITTGTTKGSVRSPEMQIQLADGQGWPNPDGSTPEWKPAKAYEYRNLATTRNGDLLVASYDAVAPNLAITGDTYRSTAAPRLLTYLRNPEGDWKLIGLANFAVPKGIPAGVDCVTSIP